MVCKRIRRSADVEGALDCRGGGGERRGGGLRRGDGRRPRGDVFDEEEVAAYVGDGGVAAGKGRAGDVEFVDTGDSSIAVITIRPDSDHRSIRGETYVPTTLFTRIHPGNRRAE